MIQTRLVNEEQPDLRQTLINVDGDDRHDLEEVGPENRGDDNVVGADLEDNVEADNDDLDEREA